ncbi:MAG TPA: nuclear transport factor 2 family protein [Alphaproteobacteria bacterium]|nr:nuclear transport factor 2 family protein [Alphaproteobacteria bacterium]
MEAHDHRASPATFDSKKRISIDRARCHEFSAADMDTGVSSPETRIAMNGQPNQQRTAMQLLERMFEVELHFIRSGSDDVGVLARAFHPDVVVHEPASLPYQGDWTGLQGIGALFRKMREVWSDMRVDGLEAARSGDTVFMACTLHLTCRASGVAISQPFAEVLRFKDDLLIDGTPFYHDTGEIVAALG